MKRTFPVLLAATLLLLNGCNLHVQEDEPAIAMKHELPLPALFADVPECYERGYTEENTKYYYYEDASIVFAEDPVACNDLYEYAIDALVEYKRVAESVENSQAEALQGSTLLIQTLEFDCVLVEEEDLKLHVLVGYASDGASVFNITCKSEQASFEAHREEFLATLRSLRIDRAGTLG